MLRASLTIPLASGPIACISEATCSARVWDSKRWQVALESQSSTQRRKSLKRVGLGSGARELTSKMRVGGLAPRSTRSPRSSLNVALISSAVPLPIPDG